MRLTAKPATGYRFTGWQGACSGTGVCEVAMTASRHVEAIFSPTYILSVSKQGKGSVFRDSPGIDCGKTCATGFLTGTRVVLTAVAAPGYVLRGWVGRCSSELSSCTLTIDGQTKIKAIFAKPSS